MIGESLRAARAIKQLDSIRLLGICEGLPDADGVPVFADLVRLADVHDTDQLTAAVCGLAEKHGKPDRVVTATETLLHPVASASETLGLQGMSMDTVRRALDKSSLKATLARAGINTARDQILTGSEDARRFACQVGFPIVLKPPGGSGALATLCVQSAEQLELALELMQPSRANAVLAEDYLSGQELCIDTITIANEPRFHSICCYRPSILEAVEDPRIQWTCVMPRDITEHRYRDFIEQGLKAVRALAVGDAMTHMEGFLLEGGRPCFTDATLRPAGARIGPMLAFAYDIDPYLAWARVAVDGCFDGPWERKYAVGTVFLRGIGSGLVEEVQGIEAVSRQVGKLLVETRLPRVGATKSATYTGDGYITVRHPETRVVEDALQWIAQTIHVTYT
ncbi:MAG: ATP-grasp domain-containing protein, partial [Dongiaceae bacterium]